MNNVQTHSRLSKVAPRSWVFGFLRLNSLRRRIIFQLKRSYFDDLGIAIPLTDCLSCPIAREAYWYSFRDIFIDREYDDLLTCISLPDQWLDIGCHAGFFSLYLIEKRRKAKLSDTFSALLIDADPRCKSAVEKLIACNSLSSRLKFLHGAIWSKGASTNFVLGETMDSAVGSSAEYVGAQVPILSEEDILSRMDKPCDLVKLDIEGAEYEFFQNYQAVITSAKYLLTEWHSWHRGGGGLGQIKQMASDLGFEPVSETGPRTVENNGRAAQCGLILFRRIGN